MNLIPHWLRPARAEADEADEKGTAEASAPARRIVAGPDPRGRPAQREPDDEFEGEGWSFWG